MIDLLFCVAGILTGIVLGLIPGMHINNFLPLFAFFSLTGPQSFFFVIAASVSYVFSSLFPSVLLGVPNEDTSLNVLPGHRLVLEGNAYSALVVSLTGSLLVVLFSIPFMLFFLASLRIVYATLQTVVPYILILTLGLMLLSDRRSAIIIIVLSSVLGMLTFDFNALLPLLSGFFGLSTLLIALMSKSTVPPQVLSFRSKLTPPSISVISFFSCFLSSIFGFIPAVSSSIVGTIGSHIRKFDAEEFLVMMSGTNVAYMIYSFFALSILHRTRSGSAVFLSQTMKDESIFLMLGIALLAGAVSFMICIKMAGILVRAYKRVDYGKALFFSIFSITAINLALGGLFGLAVLIAATSVGLLSNFLRVKRINCMAALIVPTILVLL